jgi:hypothetical protein
MKGAKWPGDWKYDCQRCGFTFPSHKIRREWTGLHVCSNCWEPKHPLLFIKIREETAVPAFVNRDPIDVFQPVCDIVSSSGYVGLAQAGCAQAGNQHFTFAFLQEFYTHGHGD